MREAKYIAKGHHQFPPRIKVHSRFSSSRYQRVIDCKNKLVVSGKHMRVALHNISKLNEEIDKSGERLRVLDGNLMRCHQENVRNQAMMRQLYRVLQSSENMVRLQTRENDALVISKRRLVDALKACFSFEKKLHNEVSRLNSVKTSLEILQRKGVERLVEITRVNSESSELKIQLRDVQRQLNVQKKEVFSLSRALGMAEVTSKMVDAQCAMLLRQRDMFGRRVLQQKLEAELSRIKMENMAMIIDKGYTCYTDRCKDIVVLRKEIQNLRRRVKALEHTESLCHDLRTEVTCLTKTISLEMNKRAAIERMKVPHIHRHRELKLEMALHRRVKADSSRVSVDSAVIEKDRKIKDFGHDMKGNNFAESVFPQFDYDYDSEVTYKILPHDLSEL
ncbi:hypothetical protein PoB_005690400 [Plakobranchus ocellatus]|uniref:Uncharacterized protein n=1 Tax=Plakobranchus ocellatus TaxID=259542 RepID=A0AAV4CGU5_9GAST|nr:hypothetical protein PoB_005690400 [Plakobranchus ocellatus]